MSKVLLEKVKLEYFKCYQETTVLFKDLTIVVGENNAGKSCLIEALRLVSNAAQNAYRKNYREPPKELELMASLRGFVIDTKKLRIDLESVVYFYDKNRNAKITAFFNDKSRIEIYLNEYCAFAVIFDKQRKMITSNKKAKELGVDKMLRIMPQIGTIREQEKYLSKETVFDDKDTYLSSLHFRNEIYLWKDLYYSDFKQLAESTWDSLEISDPEFNQTDNIMSLVVSDNRFSAEIGKMGSGLQLWLQIMWFLSRSKDCEVIILDEPDIYMHSEMQRKILEIVREKFPQVIIATHSLEIISRVDPEYILEINKKDKKLKFASDVSSVQKIIDDIGGVSNLALINLGRQRKCLFVEGCDVEILNRFNEILYGKQICLPTFSFGGFSKISNLYGAADLFYNETSNQIKCFAIADKDYRDEIVVEKIQKQAVDKHLALYIWAKKEIENYLIDPQILFELIPNTFQIQYLDFLTEFEALVEAEKDDVFDSYATQYRIDCGYFSDEKQWDIATCNQKARDYMSKHWISLDTKLALIGGKKFLGTIRRYFQDNYKISLSNKKIIDQYTVDKIPKEIKDVLTALNQ
ncbi:uncharacterized protein BN468_01200 [Faecalibacterium sp. CAG:1138]|nr:uncharacterized protein BN468_01200 [Faecalibacterium sp. CAG:1138]